MTHGLVQRLAAVLGSAAILLFFSEFYFLNEGPALTVITQIEQAPLQLVLSLLELVLLYALLAYLFLIVIQHFDVRTLPDLFLAGVIFGWATEAVWVPVAYEAIPVSFIFPSISWHALVDVLLGWFFVRYVMRTGKLWASILLFVGLGVAWALWATWFWGDPDSLAPIQPQLFMLYAFVTSLLWIGGLLLVDQAGPQQFNITRWEAGIVLALNAILFGITALPFIPFSFALVALIGVTLLALRRSSRTSDGGLPNLSESGPAWWNYPLVLLTPLAASSIYPMLYEAGWGLPSEDVVFLLLVLGAFLYLAALIRPFVSSPFALPRPTE